MILCNSVKRALRSKSIRSDYDAVRESRYDIVLHHRMICHEADELQTKGA